LRPILAAKEPEPSKPAVWSIFKILAQGGGHSDRARRKPSTKQAAPWQRKRSRPPVPGISEPGPYARDQVKEETGVAFIRD
jgi:hypothetical protein